MANANQGAPNPQPSIRTLRSAILEQYRRLRDITEAIPEDNPSRLNLTLAQAQLLALAELARPD